MGAYGPAENSFICTLWGGGAATAGGWVNGLGCKAVCLGLCSGIWTSGGLGLSSSLGIDVLGLPASLAEVAACCAAELCCGREVVSTAYCRICMLNFTLPMACSKDKNAKNCILKD
jgi:hypothetical protein